MMLGGGNQILAVQLAHGVLRQREQAAYGDTARQPLPVPDDVVGLHFLDAHPRVIIAALAIGIEARIIEHLQGIVGMARAVGGLPQQIGPRAGEIVVVVHEGTAAQRHGLAPAIDVILLAHGDMGHRSKRDLRMPWEWRMRAVGVGQHQRMLAVRVREEIIDPILLHEPRDETEMRLAVLHAVFALRIVAGQLQLEIGKARVTEHLFDDVGHRHALIDLAVGAPRQQPQPRHQGRAIATQPVLGTGVGEAVADAVEPARLAVEQAQRNRHGLPEDLVGRDGEIFAEQIELELEQAAESLRRQHAFQQQGIRRQRCLHRDDALGLGEGGHSRRLRGVAADAPRPGVLRQSADSMTTGHAAQPRESLSGAGGRQRPQPRAPARRGVTLACAGASAAVKFVTLSRT
jgi:hypothetical protein